MKRLVVVSMSGGLDSTTLCAKALSEGNTVLPVNFSYGQKNICEIIAQNNLHDYFKSIYGDKILETVNIDLTSSIKNSIQTWQERRDDGSLEAKTELGYYMPSRNLVFMAISAVIGEIIALDSNIEHISLGLGIHKHSDIYARDYWDISPEFAKRLTHLLELNDVVKVDVYAPYADVYKKGIIEDTIRLKVPYDMTWTCYNPIRDLESEDIKYVPCLECEACKEREIQAIGTLLEGKINQYCLTIKPDVNAGATAEA